MQVTMVIKARCSFEENKTNLGRTYFPSQPIWKRWIIQEKKRIPGKKKKGRKKPTNKGKAITCRKKTQSFSHRDSYHCPESKSLALIGTLSSSQSQEEYSRLELPVVPDKLLRSGWLEHNKLLMEQSREIFPISSLGQIPSVCQFWHCKQSQKWSSVNLIVYMQLHLSYITLWSPFTNKKLIKRAKWLKN